MMITTLMADYLNVQHARDIVTLLDAYAMDPMGGGEALSEDVRKNLVQELAKRPWAFTVLAYAGDQAVGLATCLESFSTFQCKPLINIHDIVVIQEYRGHNISNLLLAKVEEIARERGCCKLTLEVLEGNSIAQRAYTKFGFASYQLDPRMGNALFLQKLLK